MERIFPYFYMQIQNCINNFLTCSIGILDFSINNFMTKFEICSSKFNFKIIELIISLKPFFLIKYFMDENKNTYLLY